MHSATSFCVMDTTRLAIPAFHDSVAPRFETAESFYVCDIHDNKSSNGEIVLCSGCMGFGRIQLLQDHGIRVLICNGIKNFYRDLLASINIEVIDTISLPLNDVIDRFLSGSLKASTRTGHGTTAACEIPHDDLVCWARELFESYGYTIRKKTAASDFPIDLVASLTCPLCGKDILVAICCGAHLYRIDQEIREFHHAVSSSYHAAVYIHPADSILEENCRSYGVQLLDPCVENLADGGKRKMAVPILTGTIPGHEALAFSSGPDR